MKQLLFLNLLLFCAFCYSQNHQINKIVVDKNSKLPLENVIISNERDYSTTNSDGKFIFVSPKNQINLNLLGYYEIKTTFDKLKNTNDTIFMEVKATQLEEVVISNSDSFMKKVYSKLKENYLQNYTVNFFLRNVLKKNSETNVLQDIYARENLNTSQKKELSIEILNMRKTSFFEKKDNISFRFPNLSQFTSVSLPLINNCNYREIPFNDSDFKKFTFETIKKNEWGQIWKGYLIINRKDYAIVEYSLTSIDDTEKVPYKKSLISNAKHRTIKWNRFVAFTKDAISNKYYITNSKLEAKVELIAIKKSEKPFYYDLNIDYFVTNNPTSEKINENFSADKDIFKAKFDYFEDFWRKQNQLPLTKELELFLKSVEERKNRTKQFEIIGNF